MKIFGASVIALVVLVGCQPKPSDSELLRNLVVITDHDPAIDFTKYSTYYLLLDTISYFSNTNQQASDTLWRSSGSGDFVNYVTNTVNDSLKARGYLPVSKKSSPDLRVYIFEVETLSVYQSFSYNPYGYNYGYGYGYGYYYPSVSVSDQADLYIEIFDLKKLTSQGKPSLIWYGDLGDIASLSSANTFVRALGQAFKQSPYIKK